MIPLKLTHKVMNQISQDDKTLMFEHESWHGRFYYLYCHFGLNFNRIFLISPQFFPLWVAPNLLTFTGFLMLLVNFGVMTYYDPHFYAASNDFPEHPAIPNWVWLLGAFNNFMSHTLGE